MCFEFSTTTDNSIIAFYVVIPLIKRSVAEWKEEHTKTERALQRHLYATSLTKRRSIS